MTPFDLLERYPDRTRPLVTFYDGTGVRVELSVASTANAVAKAGSMLRDGLGLAPGALVSVDLPRHWQLPVWVLAALSVGARVGRGLTGPVDVRILGPAGLAALEAGEDPGADEVLVSSCDAFGLPVPGGVPAGVTDIGLEVRAYPDSFSPQAGASETAALMVEGTAVAWDRVRIQPGPKGGARLWVDESTSEDDLMQMVAIAPVLVGGSVVIGIGLDPDQAQAIRATEAAEVAG